MSYDLIFCGKENKPLDQRKLIEFLKKYPWFKELPKVSEEKFQACYMNEDTGVNFVFEYDKNHTCDSEEKPCAPDGFYLAGLWFNINFIRPTFYAREAMPIVEALCKETGLLVIDPQANFPPQQCIAHDLIEEWETANQLGVRAVGRNCISAYYPREKTHAWWEYMFEKQRLKKQLGEEIFVPQLFVLKKKMRNKLYEIITWADGTPSLFPKCDFVVAMKSENDTLGHDPKFSTAAIPYDKFISKLKHCLKSYNSCPREAYILYPDQQKEALKIFNQFSFSFKRKRFSGIDSIIDIKTVRTRQVWFNRIFILLFMLAVGWVMWSNIGYKSSINKAKDSWRKGDHAAIVSYAQNALERADGDQQHAVAYYWLAIGKYRLRNLQTAEEYISEALRFDSEYGAAYVTLGAIKDAKGDKQSAWAAAKRAIQLSPDYAWAHNLMGVLYLEEGNAELALIYFERAVELDPEQSIFSNNLKNAKQQSDQQ